jgi:phosphonate degradation associated HDIG domain protein
MSGRDSVYCEAALLRRELDRERPMNVTDEILAIFGRRGAGEYFGESVSMTEHALQAAYFARAEAAPPCLIAAALLHDIGHLIEDVPGDIADWTEDARHEEIGSRWLSRRLGPEVFEPVRLHVPAKRYLCATDMKYFAMLSPASVLTLKLQGGPMSPAESAQFETERYFREAVRVRRWDDQGKVAGLTTPSLGDYRALIEGLVTHTR